VGVPVAARVVSAALVLSALIAALVAATLLLPSSALDRLWALNPSAAPWFEAHHAAGVVLVVVAGLAAGAAGVGLWRGHRWAWWLAVLIFAMNGAGDLVRLAAGEWAPGGSGTLITGAFLVLLTRRSVRAWCARTLQGARK
jgi:uncharacterized membrane protein (DUF2068 family)